MIPFPHSDARARGNRSEGDLRVKRTVYGPITRTPDGFKNRASIAAGPWLSVRSRSIDSFTAVAVKSEPSWKCTLWRKRNVHTLPCRLGYQEVARSPSNWVVLRPFIRTNVS